MEMKHTPGPWKAQEASRSDYEVLSENTVIVDSTDEYGRYGSISNLSDANLIAAAPDLLASCLWLKGYAEVQVRRHPDATDTPQWQALLSAIAKAIGGQ